MHGSPSQCKSEGSPGQGQTGKDNFGEGLVRLSVNRVIGYTFWKAMVLYFYSFSAEIVALIVIIQ